MSFEDAFSAAVEKLSQHYKGLDEAENTEKLLSKAQKILQLENEDIKTITVRGSVDKFECNVVCKLASTIDTYIDDLSINGEIIRSARSRPGGQNYDADMWFRCHHNTRHESMLNGKSQTILERVQKNPLKRFKDTECPFSMSIKISKEGTFPCHINLFYEHNHSLESLQSLTYKAIPEDIREQILTLYRNGMAPNRAITRFKQNLRAEFKDPLEYQKALADRSKLPRRGDFYNIHTSHFTEKFGAKNGKMMMDALKTRIKDSMEEDPEISIFRQSFNSDKNQPFILVIVTPFMKRVHVMMSQSGELAFVDSSHNMEELNLSVFLVCTHSVAGALPLGIMVTSDEKRETLEEGFKQLNICIGDRGFFSQGYPKLIMTDNCDELRKALHSVWPLAILLLCTFHILQQVWRWLHDKNHQVELDDRPHLLLLVKRVLYARSEEDYSESVENLRKDDVISKYCNVQEYMEGLLQRKEEWCLVSRKGLMTRNNNTNNYLEAQFLVIKDKILDRVKEYNVVGLYDKMTIQLTEHYVDKLLSIGNGSFDGVYSDRYKGQLKTLPSERKIREIEPRIIKTGCEVFQVPSFTESDVMYTVDMDLSICECEYGSNGGVCKHQCLLWSRQYSLSSSNFLPIFSALERKRYTDLALGISPDISMFEGLRDRILSLEESASQTANFVSVPSIELPSTSTEVERTDVGIEMDSDDDEIENTQLEKADQALDRAIDYLRSTLLLKDPNLLSGIIKWSQHLQEIPISRLSSALHCFHKYEGASIKRRAKIKVLNPSRRKVPSGSRQKVSKGNRRQRSCGNMSDNEENNTEPIDSDNEPENDLMIPNKSMTTGKKRHSLAYLVKNNQNVEKKRSRMMLSKRKAPLYKKNENKQKVRDCKI